MPSAWPASRSASPGRCSTSSSAWHRERPRARWRGSPTTRSCRRTWPARRRGSARRAPICSTPWRSIYAAPDDIEPIELPTRARVRLACTNAIHGAIEVADYTYKAAGVDAIFPGSPFERRFRDIHTLSQQIQSRTAHFEAVGQVLLGMPPEVFF